MDHPYYNIIKDTLSRHPYTWLVTGVAGFIGSHLLENLLRLNQKVIGIDNFSTGYKKNIDTALNSVLPSQVENFYFFEGDITSLEDCMKVAHHTDYVLHQAALGSVSRSIEEPETTHLNNVNGFLNMLIAAKEAKVKRFIYASSSSVYGDSPLLPKKENDIGNPLSPYAVSKLTNELYANVFGTCYDIETIGLRYFNAFGPRQDEKGPYAAVIPRWINALKNDEPIYINGDGDTSRDFCYIDNIVQANVLAAMTENPNALNKVYNVAIGESYSLKELYESILQAFHLIEKNKPIYQDFRPGDIRYSLADITLTQNQLNFFPQYNLQKGLKKWHSLSNKELNLLISIETQ